jgi:hypothetical protein
VSPTYRQIPQWILTCDIRKISESISNWQCERYGYDLTTFPALATPEYKIYSGYKIQGGIGDNLASMVHLADTEFD